jgi:hypothetical protein
MLAAIKNYLSRLGAAIVGRIDAIEVRVAVDGEAAIAAIEGALTRVSDKLSALGVQAAAIAVPAQSATAINGDYSTIGAAALAIADGSATALQRLADAITLTSPTVQASDALASARAVFIQGVTGLANRVHDAMTAAGVADDVATASAIDAIRVAYPLDSTQPDQSPAVAATQ